MDKTESLYEVKYRQQYLDWPAYTNFVRLQLPSAPEYNSQLNTKVTEAYTEFITGARDINEAEFEKFKEELRALGLDKLKEEANEYLKKYYK